MPSTVRLFILIALCAFSAPLTASAGEKSDMPDLSQTEQTCLPTATANLLIWFGHHGYSRLLPLGGTEEDRDWSVVQRLMTDTNARFDLGTRMDLVVDGIDKYLRDAGYGSDIEYRGLAGSGPPFTQDWLNQNVRSDTGFILLFIFCHWDPDAHILSPALRVGHAVTLVTAEPDFLLVHDPGHLDDETGRKILTPTSVGHAIWQDTFGSESADGLLLLSGSLLHAPDNTQVLLAGAIRVTVRKDQHSVATEPAPGPALAASTEGPSWWSALYRVFFPR